MKANSCRLPRDPLPVHYKLFIKPFVFVNKCSDMDYLMFQGEVEISLTFKKPFTSFSIHNRGLTIITAKIISKRNNISKCGVSISVLYL